MTDSNLSRIKPQLRTTGRVTGNFGNNKVKAGSSMNDIGFGEVGSMPTKAQYFETLLYTVYPRADVKWRRSAIHQLRQLAATLNRCAELKQTVLAYAN